MFGKVKKSFIKFAALATLFSGNPSNALGNTEGHAPGTKTNNPNTELLTEESASAKTADLTTMSDNKREMLQEYIEEYIKDRSIKELIDKGFVDQEYFKEHKYTPEELSEMGKSLNSNEEWGNVKKAFNDVCKKNGNKFTGHCLSGVKEAFRKSLKIEIESSNGVSAKCANLNVDPFICIGTFAKDGSGNISKESIMSAENIVVIFDGSNKSKHGHIGAVFNKNGKQIECSEAEQPFSNSIRQVGDRYGRTYIFISEEAYPGTIMIKDIARYCVDSPERLKNAIFTIGNEYRTEQIQKRLNNNHNNANRQPNVDDSTNTPKYIKKIMEISNKGMSPSNQGMPNFTKIYNRHYNGR